MIMITKQVIKRHDLSTPIKDVSQVKYKIFGVTILSVITEEVNVI